MSSDQTTVAFKTYGASPPENYERYFVPAIGEPVARDLIDRAALRARDRVLDVACGTGIVTRLAAEQVGPTGSVAGLDVNPGMLAVARAVTPPEVTIDWHEASAEAMPLPDAAFDVVLCQMGLQFVPDKPAALREIHRVLAPGGRLVLNVPGPTPAPMAIMADALATHVGAQVAGFVHAVFSLHDRAEVLDLLEAAGFRHTVIDRPTKRVTVSRDFLWQYVHSTPMSAVLTQVGDDVLAAVEQDVFAGWQPFTRGDAVTLEVGLLTAIARRSR